MLVNKICHFFCIFFLYKVFLIKHLIQNQLMIGGEAQPEYEVIFQFHLINRCGTLTNLTPLSRSSLIETLACKQQNRIWKTISEQDNEPQTNVSLIPYNNSFEKSLSLNISEREYLFTYKPFTFINVVWFFLIYEKIIKD